MVWWFFGFICIVDFIIMSGYRLRIILFVEINKLYLLFFGGVKISCEYGLYLFYKFIILEFDVDKIVIFVVLKIFNGLSWSRYKLIVCFVGDKDGSKVIIVVVIIGFLLDWI